MRNRLQKIFEDIGIDKISPSDKLLNQLEMSRKRFFQLLENRGSHEMTVSEKLKLEAWLHGVQKTDFRLFNEAGQLKIEN